MLEWIARGLATGAVASALLGPVWLTLALALLAVAVWQSPWPRT